MKKLFLIVFGSPTYADKAENCLNWVVTVLALAKGVASEKFIRDYFEQEYAQYTLEATPAVDWLLANVYFYLGYNLTNLR